MVRLQKKFILNLLKSNESLLTPKESSMRTMLCLIIVAGFSLFHPIIKSNPQDPMSAIVRPKKESLIEQIDKTHLAFDEQAYDAAYLIIGSAMSVFLMGVGVHHAFQEIGHPLGMPLLMIGLVTLMYWIQGVREIREHFEKMDNEERERHSNKLIHMIMRDPSNL